jgi:hypothetical protein
MIGYGTGEARLNTGEATVSGTIRVVVDDRGTTRYEGRGGGISEAATWEKS